MIPGGLLMAAGRRRSTPPAPTGPTLVQAHANRTASGFTLAAPATAGNLLVAATTGTTGFADISGWTRLADVNAGSNPSMSMFAKVAAGGEQAITVTEAGTTAVAVAEFSGATAVLDQPAATATSSTTSVTSLTVGPVTPTATSLIVVAHGTNDNPGVRTWPAAGNEAATVNRVSLAWRVTDQTVQPTVTWTTARRSTLILAAFTPETP